MLCVLRCWLCCCSLVFGLFVIVILFVDSFVIVILLLFINPLIAVDVTNTFGAFDISGTGDSIKLPLYLQVLQTLREQIVLVFINVIELSHVVPFRKEVDFLKIARGNVTLEVDCLLV